MRRLNQLNATYFNSMRVQSNIRLIQSNTRMNFDSWFKRRILRARSIRPKIPVWISEIFVCRMERYFPPGRTDLVLFPLEHISHQELLDRMLKDRDEVAVLSAVSCFMWRSSTCIQNSTLDIYERNLRLFSRERMQTGRTDPQEIQNDQSTIFQEIRS